MAKTIRITPASGSIQFEDDNSIASITTSGSVLTVSGSTNFKNGIIVTGSMVSTAPASFSGSLSVTGSLGVTGTSTAAGLTTAYQFNTLYNGDSYKVTNTPVLDYGDGLRILYAGGSHKITMYTNSGTPRLQIVNNGNIQIGTTTDTGAKFTIQGSGTTSATTSFLVQNSGGSEKFRIYDGLNSDIVMSSNPKNNGDGIIIQSLSGTTMSPSLTFKPLTGSGQGRVYSDANRLYLGMTNTSGVASNNAYLFTIDNRLSKFAVTPDGSTTDASFYGKAIWDGGAAMTLRASSATQTANIFNVDNFDSTSSFLSVTATGNVGVGTSSPTQKLLVVGNVQGTNLISTSNVACGNVLYNNNFYCESSGNTNIGGGQAPATARLQVKSSGTTSSTTALLVQNANASSMLSLTDNGALTLTAFQTSSTSITVNRTLGTMGNNFNLATMGSLVNLTDTVGNSNASKTTLYINTAGASQNNALIVEAGYVGFGTTSPGSGFNSAYFTTLAGLRVNYASDYQITSRDYTSRFNTLSGGGISFWGDASGQASGQTAYAGIRGLKANNTYVNPLGNLAFYVQTGSSSHVVGEGTFKEVGRFNELGYLGIGTSSPAYTLDVSGSARFTNTIYTNFAVATATTAVLARGFSDGNFQLVTQNGASVSGYGISTTFGMIYSGSGDVAKINFHRGTGAGTGHISISSPLKIGDTSTTAPAAQFTVKGSGTTSSTTSLLIQNSSTTTLLQVKDDGEVTVPSLSTTGPVVSTSGVLSSVAGYSGMVTIQQTPMPPITLDIQNGIIVNVF